MWYTFHMSSNHYLVWLNWPIGAFRAHARDVAALADAVRRVAPGGKITCVRSARAFKAALPTATHAIVWAFEKAWFASAPRLRVLATPGAGRELLPADDELPPGVVRVNGTFHGAFMSETVIGFMFAHARGLYTAHAWQLGAAAADGVRPRNALWPRGDLSPYCTTVAGSKAVILGYGHIGRILGAKLEALGVRVAGIRRANAPTLPDEVRDADWLIVCLPSDTGTDHLVNAALLRRMKRTAVLINVGRGNAVDEAALATALRRHRLAAAYLDVFRHEPLTEASPLAEDLPGLVRLPHASAFSPDYRQAFFRELEKGGWLT